MHNILTAIDHGHSINVTGLRGGAAALLIGRAVTKSNSLIFCITPSVQQSEILANDLKLFTDIQILLYPAYEIPPYTPLSPDNRTVASRLATLYRILTTTLPLIVISSAEALLRRTIPANKLSDLAELVISNEEIDQEKLSHRLIMSGYERTGLVQAMGEFSVRGGIMDVFPPGFDYPVRFDFFGDMVESVRLFDPVSQRSIEQIDEIELVAVHDVLLPQPKSTEFKMMVDRFDDLSATLGWESTQVSAILERLKNQQRFPGIEFLLPLFYQSAASPFSYIKPKTTTFIIDPPGISRSINLLWQKINLNHQKAQTSHAPVLPPNDLFLNITAFNNSLGQLNNIRLYDFASSEMEPGELIEVTAGNHILLKQQITIDRRKQEVLQPLAAMIIEWLDNRETVCLACHSSRHVKQMAEMFARYNLPTMELMLPAKTDPLDSSNNLLLAEYPLSQGFDLPAEQLHYLSADQLFGLKQTVPVKKDGKPPSFLSATSFEELNHGDIVVHKVHGLGLYEGLVNLEFNGIISDFLQLTYQNGDTLYVPVDQLNIVSQYKGLTDKKPKLDKLGSKGWISRQSKVKEAVWYIAQDLLNIYARRQLEKSRAFSRPGEMYQEVEESFPFEETTGQHKAINDVIADLTTEQTMDRLICGDVGYGKTEVAVRAAAKVVEDNYQVAILAPTTVLVEQHSKTFRERFAGFAVRVESLSRFKTSMEQKQIVNDLAAGRVDIVIGTHRLFSKDIVFKRLGLLIIDEEHRFGVTHKEKLKKIRANVDVLTLTATPIPRTLQFSLLGIRDLSVISSPPEHRRTVKTFVAVYDDLVIKEAVSKELKRGGQVFLVHNRVHSINKVALNLQQLVPQARVAVAHGQMSGKNLEEIMVRFVRREVDVLVSTTIIESGLDIPSANTIIINRADQLGLAGIYQLRGRVGRSSTQAYAYLLVPSLDNLSKDAQQRLRALMDCNELGGGFKLAMNDLQIRGGGNILGVSQSGNIAAVGYDLYLELLQQTVLTMKRKAEMGDLAILAEEIEPEINLRISAYIPSQYISDINQRYLAYRRISCLDQEEALLDLQDELRDRYGMLPPETINLFKIVALKGDLKRLRIKKLELGVSSLVFTFDEQTAVTPQTIMRVVAQYMNNSRFINDTKLIIETLEIDAPDIILKTTKKILRVIIENDIKHRKYEGSLS